MLQDIQKTTKPYGSLMHTKCYMNADIVVKLLHSNEMIINLDWPQVVTGSNYNQRNLFYWSPWGNWCWRLNLPSLLGAVGSHSAAVMGQLRAELCSRSEEMMMPNSDWNTDGPYYTSTNTEFTVNIVFVRETLNRFDHDYIMTYLFCSCS